MTSNQGGNRKQRRAAASQTAGGAAQRLAELFQTGLRHHQAGDLATAESCYREILARDPGNAPTLHLLGVVAHQGGRPDTALDLIAKAIARNRREPAFHGSLGNALKDVGRLEEAVASYRRALSLQADHAGTHNNLGIVLQDLGRLDDAIAAFRRALLLAPSYVEAESNLGTALQQQGKFSEAATCYHRALALRPSYAEAHVNLGNLLKQQGDLAAAADCYARALAQRPDHVEAQGNLALLLQQQGRVDEAIALLRRGIAAADSAALRFHLGNALKSQDALDEAIESYRRAVALKPDHAEAQNNLGVALQERGLLAEAVAAFRHSVTLAPHDAEAQTNLGVALQHQGRADEALACFERAVGLAPQRPELHSNWGNALKEAGALERAIACYEQALALDPAHADAHSNLATALQEQGRITQAIERYRIALDLKPDAAAVHSNLLLCLNYAGAVTPEALLAEHRSFEAQHAAALGRDSRPYENDRAPERRLRIGYVSPDFRSHSVAWFLEPVLRAHDRARVEIFCYADLLQPDAVSARFRGLADHWRDTLGVSDGQLAEQIRADQIDILVDLAGHTARNRLLVFARRPAPLQLTWLGYPATSGLAAIGCRIVDGVTDPIGTAEAAASETLLRLPGGFLCYGPPADAPEPAPRPSLAAAPPTFGSFNNPSKLSPACLDAWAALLRRCDEARLLLKGRPFGDATARALLLARMAERGIAGERIELLAWLPPEQHLALYHRVDIALDPFPYNGTTTSCEALWMGVPVVSLAGDRHAARVGASILTQVGLPELAAASPEAYVEIAAALAGDAGRLAGLSAGLRARMAGSALCDARSFAAKLETAYRTLWHGWVGAAGA